MKRPAVLSALWLAAAAVTALSFGFTRARGSDLWWHLATGRLVLESRSVPVVDPWSFTCAGAPWLQHEWLSDVLLAGWAGAFGVDALVFLKWAVLAATAVVLLDALLRTGASAAASYLAVLLALAVGAPFLDLRPQLVSLLASGVLLSVLLSRTRLPAWLPLVFLLWANLHAGFFFGLLAVALAMSAGGRASLARREILIAAGCALAPLVNPNGAEAYLHPLRYALDPSFPWRSIAEWRPPFAPGGIPSPLYPLAIGAFVAAAAFLLGSRERRRDRARIAALLVSSLALAMSLRSRRFVPLFAVCEAFVVAPAIGALLDRALRRVPPLAPAALALLFGAARLRGEPLGTRAFPLLTEEASFPKGAVDFAESTGRSGNVFAYYNWGGYLHLRTAGRLRVFIDGRADTVFDGVTYGEYLQVLARRPGWTDVVERCGADYVLWPRADLAVPSALLGSGRWESLYADRTAVLLARRGSRGALVSATPGSSRP